MPHPPTRSPLRSAVLVLLGLVSLGLGGYCIFAGLQLLLRADELDRGMALMLVPSGIPLAIFGVALLYRVWRGEKASAK